MTPPFYKLSAPLGATPFGKLGALLRVKFLQEVERNELE